MTGRLHIGNGLCATRLPDGSVYLEQFEGVDLTGPIVKGSVLQSGPWAALVAHVSARGLSEESKAEALAWHQSMPALADADDALEDTAVTEPRL